MRRPTFAGLIVGVLLAGATGALAVPIPSTPDSPVFTGHPAVAHPIRGVAPVPHNPFMAPNGASEIHNDGWQTDAYTWGGPLGRSPKTFSTYLPPGHDCGSITFDRRGRVISVCVGISGPQLYMFNPRTLAQLATFSLPPRQDVPDNIFQDFTGGGYFYLDAHDRVVTATTTKHIYVIAEMAHGVPGFRLVHDYDLSHVITSKEKITSALPDSGGLLWFVTKTDGTVGTLNLASGRIRVIRLGHGGLGEIENSFAVGAHRDVYIATNRKLYRFYAASNGTPRVAWQIRYPNSFKHKPGQVDDGTGTTPTVMAGGFVNITDNADPMDVVVYRTALHPSRLVRRRGHRHHVALSRLVCRVAVFHRGAGDTENSLIGAGRSMIVENNYGYTGPTAVTGTTTAAGFARVDLNRNGRGCHLVWTDYSVAAPTVVPKLSLASGLIYAYTKPGGDPLDPWYWTALDFRTGRVVYRQLAGTGNVAYNNNYAGLALSRSGTAYLGVLSGIIAMRDSR